MEMKNAKISGVRLEVRYFKSALLDYLVHIWN